MTKVDKARAIMPHLLSAAARQQVNALTWQAERARSMRASNVVESIADRLLEITPYRLSAVGFYYKAISRNNQGAGSPESEKAFTILSGSNLPIIRARANLALGSQAFIAGDYGRALRWYKAAARELDFEKDPIGCLHLGNMRAAAHGAIGKHEQAASELLQLLKITKVTKTNLAPLVYNLWNSLATEMLRMGEVDAAGRISNKVVASPYVSAYPEWMETREEIQRATQRAASIVVPETPCLATVHHMDAYRAAQAHKEAGSYLNSSIGRLYLRSQQVAPEVRQFIEQSVEVLLFHTDQPARPPTVR